MRATGVDLCREHAEYVDVMTETRALAGVASASATAYGALSVTQTVRAVTEAIHSPDVTVADLQALAAVLTDVIRAATSTEQAPMFGPVGRFLNANTGLVTLVATLLTLLVTLLGVLQDRVNNARVNPPPTVTVQIQPPDPAEVDRLVDERLREPNMPIEPSDGEPQHVDPPPHRNLQRHAP